MPRLRELNNHNTAKKNGYFLGHSDNLITLSLSLRRSPIRETVTPFILRAGRPRQGQCKPSAEPSSLGLCRGAACPRPKGQYTAFLASMQEKSDCFFCPRRTTAAGR